MIQWNCSSIYQHGNKKLRSTSTNSKLRRFLSKLWHGFFNIFLKLLNLHILHVTLLLQILILFERNKHSQILLIETCYSLWIKNIITRSESGKNYEYTLFCHFVTSWFKWSFFFLKLSIRLLENPGEVERGGLGGLLGREWRYVTGRSPNSCFLSYSLSY